MSVLRAVPRLVLFTAIAACGDGVPLSVEPEAPGRAFVGAGHDAWSPTPASEVPVLVGAGDIADCGSPGDEWTGDLLDGLEGTVITIGDNAYPNGSFRDFIDCYDPSWGRHRDRTLPSLGNHEYLTPAASGYFRYFRERAGPPGLGFYSYDLRGWHVVVLNSTLEYGDQALQRSWPVQDLARHPTACAVAYFHHPRFSSGLHGDQPQMQAVWSILYQFGVDVVLAAHDHNYERWAPQDLLGRRDDAHGIRQFVVGTGGGSLRGVTGGRPNSEFRDADHFGVLELSLGEGSYRWAFLATDGTTSWTQDEGEDTCHAPPPAPL